jgi:hypothetical protein
MKATELRIGNYVYGYSGDNVTAVTSAWFLFKTAERANPIPLNEEWLVKFGFDPGKPIKALNILSSYNLGNFGCKLSYSGAVGPNIQHVHQLQNLYFALTGEELTIKL